MRETSALVFTVTAKPVGPAAEQEGGLDAWVEPWVAHLVRTLAPAAAQPLAAIQAAEPSPAAAAACSPAPHPSSPAAGAAAAAMTEAEVAAVTAENTPTTAAAAAAAAAAGNHPAAVPPPLLADGLGHVLVLFGSQVGAHHAASHPAPPRAGPRRRRRGVTRNDSAGLGRFERDGAEFRTRAPWGSSFPSRRDL